MSAINFSFSRIVGAILMAALVVISISSCKGQAPVIRRTDVRCFSYVLEVDRGKGFGAKQRIEIRRLDDKFSYKDIAYLGSSGGREVRQWTVCDGNSVWFLNARRRLAMEVPADQDGQSPARIYGERIIFPIWDAMTESKKGLIEFHSLGADVLRDKKGNTFKAKKYWLTFTTRLGPPGEYVLYVDEGGRVRRIETLGKGDGEKGVMDLVDVKINPNFRPGTFEVPPGYNVVDEKEFLGRSIGIKGLKDWYTADDYAWRYYPDRDSFFQQGYQEGRRGVVRQRWDGDDSSEPEARGYEVRFERE